MAGGGVGWEEPRLKPINKNNLTHVLFLFWGPQRQVLLNTLSTPGPGLSPPCVTGQRGAGWWGPVRIWL